MEVTKLIQEICRQLNVDEITLKSKSKKREIVIVRQAIFFLLRKNTTLTLKQIGKVFNRDHTTVIAGIKKIIDNMRYEDVSKVVNKIDKIMN